MKNNLNSLVVDTLIVHDVPKKFSKRFVLENPDTDAEDIILSEVPTEFDNELTRFFHDRITATIGSNNAFEIEFDLIRDTSKTQKAIKEYFKLGIEKGFPLNDSDCLRLTQDIAIELHDVQTARNPGGMLLFIPCHNNKKNGIAILKVEREEGVSIKRDYNNQGKTTFSAQHIKDLMLTKNTRLFKIVLFYQENDNIVGYLCDQQQGSGNKEVADFFLSEFLGCKLKEEPNVSTKKFFETVSDFINTEGFSDNEKVEIHTHLISELTNNTQTIQVLDFAKRSLPTDKIQKYMDALAENNVVSNFKKDLSMIADKIKRVRYELECGIKILGTENVIKEKLTLYQLKEGQTKIELIDRIRKVESK